MTAFDIFRLVVGAINAIALLLLIGVAVGFLGLTAHYLHQRGNGAFRRSRPTVAVDDEALPRVLVQLPVFNEPDVVEGLLEAVAALDWPADKLHIQLLDDSSDETVEMAQAKIEQLGRRGLNIDHVRRSHRTGYKAEALATGLALSDAPYFAILDADFRPPANWLRAVVPQLLADPRAGFIQSRCEFVNADDNWLTRAQGLLLDTHFVMEQAVRARAGLLIQCNGTGAVWRRAALDAAGGWSGASLSEDLDLAVRAALAGWRGLFAFDPVVPGLVPNQIHHWRQQQKRWSMGFAQNARSLAARIWSSDWTLRERFSAEFLLLYQAALPIVVVAVVAGLEDLALGLPDWPIILPLWALTGALVVAVSISMTLPPYLELKRGGPGRYAGALAAVPPLVVFLAFTNAKAILTGFLGRNAIFHRTPKANSKALDG